MSAIQSHNNVIPNDVLLNIFSKFKDPKDLGRVQCVCKWWNGVANTDMLWKNALKSTFNEEVPAGQSNKKTLISKYVKDLYQLHKIYVSFLCHIEWDKRRQFECTFKKEPNAHITAEQAFGPTRLFSQAPADVTEHYEFIGELKQKASDSNIVSSQDLGDKLYYQACAHASEGFSVLEDIQGFSFQIKGETSNCSFAVKIEKDVGFENTLAFYSDINDWKYPFKLTWQNNKWVGIIPYGAQFKFVKIDSTGKVIWENQDNRSWSPRCGGRPYPTFEDKLKAFPITF